MMEGERVRNKWARDEGVRDEEMKGKNTQGLVGQRGERTRYKTEVLRGQEMGSRDEGTSDGGMSQNEGERKQG